MRASEFRLVGRGFCRGLKVEFRPLDRVSWMVDIRLSWQKEVPYIKREIQWREDGERGRIDRLSIRSCRAAGEYPCIQVLFGCGGKDPR